MATNMTPRFVFLKGGAAPTGASKRYDRLINSAVKQGYEVLVISPHEGLVMDGPETLVLGRLASLRPRSVWLAIALLCKWKNLSRLRGHRANVVLVFGETPLLAAYLLTKWTQANLSVGVRSNRPKRDQILKGNTKSILKKIGLSLSSILMHAFLRKVYAQAQQVIVQSDRAKIELCQNFSLSQETVEVIENDVPPLDKTLKQRERKGKQATSLLFLGGSSYIKGFDIFTMAMPSMHVALPSLESITIVNLPASKISTVQGIMAGLPVQVRAYRRREDILDLMIQNDVVVVPSREDQFPNVILESAAVGTPVIGSNLDGIRYLLQDPTVLFYPSPTGLLGCLSSLSSTEGYICAVNALQNVMHKRQFDWPKCYLDMVLRNINRQHMS